MKNLEFKINLAIHFFHLIFMSLNNKNNKSYEITRIKTNSTRLTKFNFH
jgi:hypothetical protein